MVLVLGREIVNGQSTVYLCLSKYIGFQNTHTHIATTAVASGTEGVAAVSCMESHMNRRPLGSIDPNSIRETELHTECRRRHSRGERESLHSPQLDRVRDAARQRAAATRRRETDEARATHRHSNVRVTTKALGCNCWGTYSDTSTSCVDEPRRCHVYCCTAVTAVVSS